jgi:DNA-binding XRE family transcriptional regulator
MVGVTRETVCRLERGHEGPTWATARALAAALGVTPERIFPGHDERPVSKPGAVTTSATRGRRARA